MINFRRKFIKVKFGVVILSFFIFSMSATCQNSKYDSGVPVPIYEEGCSSLMSAMHKQWQNADGELGIIFCKQLIWGLLLEPNAFYKEFTPDSESYNRFLDCVGFNLFRNYNDTTTEQYYRLKQVVIDRLTEKTYSIDSTYLKIHEELIEKIRKVKPTFVD